MADSTSLGDRMKRHEAAAQAVLPRRAYMIIRVDGRAFHTYLRYASRPFDPGFLSIMDATAEALCAEVSGAVLAYVQSDEISVLATDIASVHSEPWFGGEVQKIASVAAGIATAEFNHAAFLEITRGGIVGLPHTRAVFDARVFTVADPVEAANYCVWRQRDCTRNSISMAAQAYFSHQQLHGMDAGAMQELLFQEQGINWSAYSDSVKRGRVCVRTVTEKPVTFTDGRDGQETTLTVERNQWETKTAPRFSAEPGSFLAGIIPPMPSLSGSGSGS